MSVLKKGMSGEPVKKLQLKLGNVNVDGVFGSDTENSLKYWQTSHGLVADGVAGPDTFMAMHLYELVLLQSGAIGESVKTLQTKLGVKADGVFGPDTEKAVRDFQSNNGLQVDGQAGPFTLAKMKTFAEITEDTIKASLRSIWDTLVTVIHGPIIKL